MGGAAPATTNNRMELTAALEVLEALRDLPRHPDLVLRTDSRYLIDGFEKWMAGWKRKGWRTASGGAVLNRDLWEKLDAARLPGVPLRHVRGHSGDPDNERCDAIAVAFCRGQPPVLALEHHPSPEALPADRLALEESKPSDTAPASLQQLLSRLELADRLAAGGYGLTAVELARLLEVPIASLEGKADPWPWRDWLVRPLGDGRWRLERGAGGLARQP
jgi:ribonuclease HI